MRHYFILATLVTAAALLPVPAMAAPIVWQSPQTISGDSDVSTAGTPLYAVGFGNAAATNETIHGVTFTAFNAANGGDTVTQGNVTVSGIDPNFSGAGAYTGSGSAPFTGLSAPYQELLTQVVFAKSPGEAGGPVNLVLTMNGLTAGHLYQFEAWSNDSRASQGGSSGTRSETITDGTSASNPLFYNSATPVEGGLGSFIIGKFIASGSSETLTFIGNASQGDAQINAFQLRTLATPEPTALALFGLGAFGLLAASLRRRKSR
jgi:hypothetical protein